MDDYIFTQFSVEGSLKMKAGPSIENLASYARNKDSR